MLGGGVRGQYRVNRAASWNSAAAANHRKSEGPAQPAQGSRTMGGNSRLPHQRPQGLPVAPAALARFEMPKQPEPAGQHRVSDPLAFRASDLAFQEPSPTGVPKPSPKGGARYATRDAVVPWGALLYFKVGVRDDLLFLSHEVRADF